MANGSRLTGVANGLGPRKISRNARCHHMHKRRGRPERSPSSGRQQARRRTGRPAHGCEPSARTREDPSAGRDREPVCEPHDSTGEPGAGNRHAGFGERGEETCPRESACGPVAKAPDKPPAPYRQRASSRLYYRLANFTKAQPLFRCLARLGRGKVIPVSVLSAEKRQQNSDAQGAVAKLKTEKSELASLVQLLRETISRLDRYLARVSDDVKELNILIVRLGLGEPVSVPGYSERARLDEIQAAAEAKMRNVVHLIEAKEKSIKNLTDEMRQHAVLLEKRRAAEVERGKLMAQWNTLQAERATLKEKRENRSRLFRELLNSVVEQRHQYVMIIKKFSASKDAVLSDLDFEAELRFDRDKLLWAIEDLADNRRVQIVRADRTPAVCDRATEALQRVACGDEGDIDATVGEVDGLAERLKPNLKTARTGTVLDLYRVLY